MFADFDHSFYYLCLLLSALVSIIWIKKAEHPFGWIGTLILVTLCSELIAKYLAFHPDLSNNNTVYHFFTPIEYLLYVVIYLQFLGHPKWRLPLWLSAAGLILFEILNTIYLQPLNTTNTNVMIVESVFLVSLSLLLFLKIREEPFRKNLLREGIFWFNSAVLCYYAFNILIWGFHNLKIYYLENPSDIMYDINRILGGLLYLSFSAAILLDTLPRLQTNENHD